MGSFAWKWGCRAVCAGAIWGAASLALPGAVAQTGPEPVTSEPLITIPPLRSSVSDESPMDIGIDLGNGEDQTDTQEDGETQAPADEGEAGNDAAADEAGLGNAAGDLVDDAAAAPADAEIGGLDAAGDDNGLTPPETGTDAAGGDASSPDLSGDLADELANGPSLLGFPESREELRPSGTAAVLRGLDKITGRITVVEAPVGKPVTFGKLEILVSYCYKRPPEEPPEVTAFVQVTDLRAAHPESEKVPHVFSGWMFASSPALSAVEHPVYDVWLIDCKADAPESSFGSLSNEPTPKELDAKRP